MINKQNYNWNNEWIIYQNSEINWKKTLLNNDIDIIKEKSNSCIVNFWNIWINIKVYFTNPKYEELLHEKFEISNNASTLLPELIFCESNENEWCFINNWLYIKWNWFWLLKSVISWYATYLKWDLLPMHTSVIDTSIWWLSFIWWHWWWKTTALINAMEILDKLSLNPTPLTDDWWWAKITDNGNIDFLTIDRSISLNNKIYNENSWLKVFDNINISNIESRKISISPDKLYWTKKIYNTKLKSIILLDQSWLNLEKINKGRFITDSAYHYPYISQWLISEHSNKWNKSLSWLNVSLYNRVWNFQDFIKKLIDSLTK